MRILVVILSILLFAQSFALCSGNFERMKNLFETAAVCTMNYSATTSSASTKKSCCQSAKMTEDSSKTPAKGCCGDDCRCFSCVKVFNLTLHTFRLSEIQEEKYAQKVMTPVNVHSYDYHASISYPPQV